jgi:hypothetical protein
VCRRASRVLLGGLVLFACAACGGGRGGERFELYHLESAIGPPGANGELRCGPPRSECPGVLERPPTHVFRYEVRGPPAVSGDEIDRDSVRRLTDPATGAPVLSLALTPEGRRAFARLTKEVARTGGRDQGWHHLAVVVGDEIVAFPEVDFDVYPDGIPNAPGIQFPAASEVDARELVERLRDG